MDEMLPLKLDDPATIEELKAVDVLAKPAVDDDMADKIAGLEKTEVTISLSREQIGRLQKEANYKHIPWEKHLDDVIAEALGTGIGRTVISGPSKMNGVAASSTKIVGPSWVRR